MVAGKVKMAMGLQKSPAHSKANGNSNSNASPKPPSPASSAANKQPQPQKGGSFSRSFGVYFPRASAQVQPRPPDATELLRLVEELRERESRLKTQLLEQKLLKETVAIVPVLENQISVKDLEIERFRNKIECLEIENERLREEVEVLHMELSKQNSKHEEKLKDLESEIFNLKKANEELVLASQKNATSTTTTMTTPTTITAKMTRKCFSQNYSTRDESVANVKPDNEVKKDDASVEGPRHSRSNSEDMIAESSDNVLSLRSRGPRVPKPPPRPSSSSSSSSTSSSSLFSSSSSPAYSCSMADSAERALAEISNVPPPPPPPPRPPVKAAPAPPPPPPPPSLVKGSKAVPAKVRRVPEVVEFYHSLMRRDSRRDSSGGGGGAGAVDAPVPAAAAKDMIGEIENRSAHLLAIKTDVETQGEFIRFLIKEVENAAFTDIEDVVPFVKWLDDELSYLVDERAVLKHFEWPEQKADALREAAFEYSDMKKLELETSSFRDDPRQPCARALKKMQALFEKLEHEVYNLSRKRESAANRYKNFNIPTGWMQDKGFVSQIKLASVKLAMKYMKRVSAELETVVGGPDEEELIIQGVRFAFRVHQFAGGFDVETMRAFQELRDKAKSCHVQCQNHHQQQHQKIVCSSSSRSTAY